LILHYYRQAQKAMDEGADLNRLIELPSVESVSRAKRIPEDKLEEFDALCKKIDEEAAAVTAGQEATAAKGAEQ
jgi:V/A-type H+/Na+-transporting ATPase subunit A